jgi:hypothetical protein
MHWQAEKAAKNGDFVHISAKIVSFDKRCGSRFFAEFSKPRF